MLEVPKCVDPDYIFRRAPIEHRKLFYRGRLPELARRDRPIPRRPIGPEVPEPASLPLVQTLQVDELNVRPLRRSRRDPRSEIRGEEQQLRIRGAPPE